MCGYCTENAALSYALQALGEASGGAVIEIDSFIFPSYIQDAAHWEELVMAWPGNKGEQVTLLAFCRCWEDVLGGKAVLPLLDVIDPTLWVKLLERLDASISGQEWAQAITSNGVLSADIPLPAALRMLEVYSHCWLTPISVDRWSDQEFYEWFPWLFLALAIVAGAKAKAPVLQTIALTDPHRTPAFDGLDLWLQRRAACACVRETLNKPPASCYN